MNHTTLFINPIDVRLVTSRKLPVTQGDAIIQLYTAEWPSKDEMNHAKTPINLFIRYKQALQTILDSLTKNS